jgi:hypothetical protein
MSFFGAFWLAKTGEDYTTDNAVWFDGSADYMIWTPPKAGNLQTFTYSFWIKRAELSHDEYVFTAGDSNTTYGWYYAATDLAYVNFNTGRAGGNNFVSNGKFRDPTAWQHVFVSFNTASSVKKVFINGLEPSAGTDDEPTAGEEHYINSTVEHRIGSTMSEPSSTFNGYLAEFILLDGVYHATPVDAFGEFDSNGIWSPKNPEDLSDWGGVNSVWLKFDDSTNLGKNSRPTAVTAAAGTYKIDKSLWLDGGADYLVRDPASSGNRRTFTFSCWLKRSAIGSAGGTTGNNIFGADRTGSYSDRFMFGTADDGNDWLEFSCHDGSSGACRTSALYRDPTAWMHVLWVIDTTQAASNNRVKLYVNGVPMAFNSPSYPALNFDTYINYTENQAIGVRPGTLTQQHYGGYLADVILLDGTAVSDPNDFGGYDTNGNWVPKDPSGLSFGTCGFHLDFALAQGSGNGPGNDVSGQNNDFTNTSLTAAQTTTDTPTNTSGDNEGNYSTLNPLDHINSSGSSTFSKGNTSFLPSTTSVHIYWTTIPLSTNDTTKYYAELETPSGNDIGWLITNQAYDHDSSATRNTVDSWYCGLEDTDTFRANEENGGNVDATLDETYVYANDRIGLAVDFANGKVWVGHVDNSAGSIEWKGPSTSMNGNPASGTNATLTPDTQNGTHLQIGVFNSNGGSRTCTIHMNPSSWVGTPPTGFNNAIYTANLPTPTVEDPRKWFAPVLYTGTGATRGVRGCYDSTGTAWTPDFVWLKSISGTTSHYLYDTCRGARKMIQSNSYAVEETDNGVMSFGSGGPSIGDLAGVNTKGATYIAWCWKAGGAPTADNTGDRTPTSGSVMKNDAAVTTSNFFASADIYPTRMSIANHGGFAIGTYAGNSSGGSSAQTIAHGLGAVPDVILQRHRDETNNQSWNMYHVCNHAGSNNPEDYDLSLDLPDAQDDNTSKWNDTAPTSTLFTVGTSSGVNGNGKEFVFYLFKRTTGAIAVGSYIGNGAADGTYVVVDDGASGFRPAFVLLKALTGSQNWRIHDAARNGYNGSVEGLFPNTSGAEDTENIMDMTSNGFKLRSTNANCNGDGVTFVYLAFAAQPFNAPSRPV